MSVTTSADQSKHQALDAIQMAIKSISKIVIDKEWGYDEYGSAYKNRLREAMNQLIEIQESIS